MDYERVHTEAIRVWRENKSAENVVVYVQEKLETVEAGELRGRLLFLLGMFQKRTGAFVDALESHRAALAQLGNSNHCADVWVSVVEIHVDLHQVEEGYRSGFEAERLLGLSEEERQKRLTPVLLNNMARVAMLHRDYASAKKKLEESGKRFRETGRVPEAQMVLVRLSEALVGLGCCDEAEALCNEVKECPESPNHALISANLLLSKIALHRRDYDAATRTIDRARSHMADHLGRQDWRVMLTLIQAEASLDEAKGDTEGANRLRSLLDGWTGCEYQA